MGYTRTTWTNDNNAQTKISLDKEKMDTLETQLETGQFGFEKAGGDSSRGVYITFDALAGTKAVRQGALSVALGRDDGQEDTTWDGNPDTAVNISARVYASNEASEGAVRGLQVAGRNSGSNINWILGANISSRNDSGKQAVSLHGMDIRVENYGNVGTDVVGLDVNLSDENSNVDPHTKHGILIRNTDQSGMGAADAAIKVSHTSTNGFTSLIEAAAASGDGFVASVATPAGNTTHAMIVTINGTEYYIPVYADVTF
jgi:hypothetical protein